MRTLSFRQGELARTMMKSTTTNAHMIRELNRIDDAKWNIMCEEVDKVLQQKNAELNDKRWENMVEDFDRIAATEHVDRTSLYVAYMEWLSNKRVK